MWNPINRKRQDSFFTARSLPLPSSAGWLTAREVVRDTKNFAQQPTEKKNLNRILLKLYEIWEKFGVR